MFEEGRRGWILVVVLVATIVTTDTSSNTLNELTNRRGYLMLHEYLVTYPGSHNNHKNDCNKNNNKNR